MFAIFHLRTCFQLRVADSKNKVNYHNYEHRIKAYKQTLPIHSTEHEIK